MTGKCKASIELAIDLLKGAQKTLESEAKERQERDAGAELVEDAWIALENMIERSDEEQSP